MLDTLVKLFFIAVSAPLWVPVLRCLKEQFDEVIAQEGDPVNSRSWNSARPEDPPLTENVDLVEEPLARRRSSIGGFAEPKPTSALTPGNTGSKTQTLRRAS